LIDETLRSVVQERWGERVVVVRESPVFWLIRLPDEEKYHFRLSVSKRGPRKLSFRKGVSDLSSWLQAYVQDAVAVKLNGVCSDEGVSERWKGDPARYRLFRQWWDVLHEPFPGVIFTEDQKAMLEECFKAWVDNMPEGIVS
jgi:hypothetical protein